MQKNDQKRTSTPFDWVIMLLSSLFFSTNIVFGRGLGNDVDPFILAFLRWSCAFLILLPFMVKERTSVLNFIQKRTRLWLMMGFLGMWICGAVVYWSLRFTTASNATLIYTTSSLFIILIERFFRGRLIGMREILGIIIAFFGITIIVLRGNIQSLSTFTFNPGDLGILLAAFSWALYSILQKSANDGSLSNLASFGMMTASGSLLLLPFAVFQAATGGALPHGFDDTWRIAGIVIFSSLLAFSFYQHAVRVFGASFAGIFFYLSPPLSIVLAVLFLNEQFETYHAFGIAFTMTGVILATIPKSIFKRQSKE